MMRKSWQAVGCGRKRAVFVGAAVLTIAMVMRAVSFQLLQCTSLSTGTLRPQQLDGTSAVASNQVFGSMPTAGAYTPLMEAVAAPLSAKSKDGLAILGAAPAQPSFQSHWFNSLNCMPDSRWQPVTKNVALVSYILGSMNSATGERASPASGYILTEEELFNEEFSINFNTIERDWVTQHCPGVVDFHRRVPYFKQLDNTKPFLTAGFSAVAVCALSYVGKVFDREGVPWVLAYGSLLGAYRHHGPTPWDDDTDIAVPLIYYDRVISVLTQLKKDGFDYHVDIGKWTEAHLVKVWRTSGPPTDAKYPWHAPFFDIWFYDPTPGAPPKWYDSPRPFPYQEFLHTRLTYFGGAWLPSPVNGLAMVDSMYGAVGDCKMEWVHRLEAYVTGVEKLDFLCCDVASRVPFVYGPVVAPGVEPETLESGRADYDVEAATSDSSTGKDLRFEQLRVGGKIIHWVVYRDHGPGVIILPSDF